MAAAVTLPKATPRRVADASRPNPATEYREAWTAWQSVAPPDGSLPADATPMQRLLYARLTTSEFVFQVSQRTHQLLSGEPID